MAEAEPFSHLTSLQSWVSLGRGVAPSVPLQARHPAPPPFKTPKSPCTYSAQAQPLPTSLKAG